ncbi:BAG4 regulator, partial [Urocolius indicus]|nr:BAG4 regulator [Urocolius indicus]
LSPPQAMDSPYSNGAYSPPYPHYTGLAQDRGYYGCGTPQSPFPSEPTGTYRPPSPSAPWSYGPGEGSSRQRQQGPGYSPPQTPSLPVPQYPYGDASPGLQGPRSTEDTWAPSSLYGLQPPYAWPPAASHGSPFACQAQPPWATSGAPSQPPAWDSQDSAYDKPEPGTNQQHCYPDGNQQQQHYSGMLSSNHKPAPSLSTKVPAAQPKVQYSAQPQLYDGASRKLQPGRASARAAPAPAAAIQPEIQRILHVMGEAEQLEQEVDEFVGRKTEKSYRLLEEMLTKLLLELDSVETGGQDSVRQARKEAVHRIQAILEKLERKGL